MPAMAIRTLDKVPVKINARDSSYPSESLRESLLWSHEVSNSGLYVNSFEILYLLLITHLASLVAIKINGICLDNVKYGLFGTQDIFPVAECHTYPILYASPSFQKDFIKLMFD